MGNEPGVQGRSKALRREWSPPSVLKQKIDQWCLVSRDEGSLQNSINNAIYSYARKSKNLDGSFICSQQPDSTVNMIIISFLPMLSFIARLDPFLPESLSLHHEHFSQMELEIPCPGLIRFCYQGKQFRIPKGTHIQEPSWVPIPALLIVQYDIEQVHVCLSFLIC